jgi:cytochrome P450
MTNTDSTVGLPSFDLYDPAKYAGERRYSYIGELRENDPPLATDTFGTVHLLRYEDVRAGHVDSARFRAMETATAELMGLGEGAYYDFQQHVVLTQNAPRHTRIRAAAMRYFTVRRVNQLKESIRQASEQLIRSFPEDEPFDFVESFAFKLPVGVIMRMLHLRSEDEPRIREWSPMTLPAGPGTETVTNQANSWMRAYAQSAIDQRRSHPLEDDIVTDLVHARDRDELDDDELWALIVALLLAGHETTTSTIALGMLALLRHPEQMALLRGDRGLAKNAVEEMLRNEPAVDADGRILAEDVELHGVTLPAGSFVRLNQASANHDPRQFVEPERFDITRSNAREHLTFGGGAHRCLGAPLAQVELPVAFEALLDELSHVELAGDPRYARTFFRGLESLPLRVRRA